MSTEDVNVQPTGDPVVSKLNLKGPVLTPEFKLTPTLEKNVSKIATKEQVEELKTELDSELEKLSKYKFLIRLKEDSINYLIDFIEFKAKWKFRNAYGIVQCYDTLREAKKHSKENDIDGIYIDNVTLEALAYFLHQHEDAGLKYAKEYISIIDPLFTSMQEASKWKSKIEILRKKYILFDDSYSQQVSIEDVDIDALEGKFDPEEV